MRRHRSIPLAALACLALACGGGTSPETGSTSQGAGGSSGAAGVGGTAGGGAPSGCPTEIPEAGSPCGPTSLVCSFGDDPFAACRPVASCSKGAWSDASAAVSCPPSRDPCPASLDGSCTPGAACLLAGSTPCECTVGGIGPGRWYCLQKPPPPCPATVPNEGAACDVPANVTCDYLVSCGVVLDTYARCNAGVWTWGAPAGQCL